jgi:ribosomal-protein-alanine N-acetyltransferase
MRRATAADHAAVERLFQELGVPDPPPDAAELAERMLPRVIAACRGEEIVGYAHWRIYDATAHVVHVVAAPHVRRLGVGRALMDATREAVAVEGCTRWYLNVKRDNAAARRLYEQCGMTIERELWALQIGWAQVDALAADGAPAAAYTPGPDEDAAIAARFELDPGRLVSLRARPGTVMLALRDGGEPLALAAFDPRFPGAAVFCAARPGLARPLLDACRAHADLARFGFVRLVIDRDRALVNALVGAGAEITLELLQMGASLRA